MRTLKFDISVERFQESKIEGVNLGDKYASVQSPVVLGPLYTRSQGRFEAKSLMPIGWISKIGPKAFTLGVKTESRKIILMFKRQDLTQPQLQELGPSRMEGQFVALGPLSNFIKILLFH